MNVFSGFSKLEQGAQELLAEIWAVTEYKSSESYKLNAKLRDGLELNDLERHMVSVLDSALEKLPKVEGQMYRTISFDDVFDPEKEYNAFMARHQEGSPIRYKAYTSTSTKADGHPFAAHTKFRKARHSTPAIQHLSSKSWRLERTATHTSTWRRQKVMANKTEWDFIPKNAAEQCARCKKHIPFTLTCKAYPNEIPDEILNGEKTCKEQEPK